MKKERELTFDSYRLDTVNECVWRGKEAIRLTTKAFAVLRYLVEQAGRLVTKDEFFQTIWPEITVSDAALTVCIGEIRGVLRDDAKAPRFIETVHRRGYRFVGKVARSQHSVVSRQKLETRNLKPETRLVGREAELTQLHKWLEKALRGERQIVFISGEPGIGKTALVETFLQSLESSAQNHEERQKAKGKKQK